MKKRIVLSDDHPLIRAGLKELLNDQNDYVVVGEAENGNYVLALIEELKPDLLITDLTMPGIPVLDIIRETKRSSPKVKIIVLSMHDDGEHIRQAVLAGADAYITKDAAAQELVKAIEKVSEGIKYLSDDVAKAFEASVRAHETAVDPLTAITPREKQVLRLAAEGHSSTEIAAGLKISRRTAETHRANLMRKLALHSQTDLVHFAFQYGLISLDKKSTI